MGKTGHRGGGRGWGGKPQPKTEALLLQRLEEQAGRDEMADALEKYGPSEEENPRYLALVNHLLDPAYANVPFSKLCKKMGLNYYHVMEVWRRSQHDLTLAVGLKHAPAVMNDIGTDARSRMEMCDRCYGEGRVEVKKKSTGELVGKPCPKCGGKGKLRKLGDKDARNTLFTAIGLGSKGSQVNTQINVGALAAEPPEATFKQSRALLSTPVEVKTDESH